MDKWTKLADKETVEKLLEILKSENIDAYCFQTGEEAKKKVLEILPKGARILSGQSQTLKSLGIDEVIENSPDFISVRKEYMALDREKDSDKIRVLRSTPDVIVGSVHAVTKDGHLITASNTGSQIASYAASAGKVILVIGAQKIVENLDEGFKRIQEHSLPLESERLKKLYGIETKLSKILIINRDSSSGRITVVFVNEVLGF